MSVYLVTWDLNREKPNYNTARQKFLNRLDNYNHIKDLGLDTVMFVSTSWNAQQISDDLKNYIDDNDTLFVVKVTSDRQGWLQTETWDWIKSHT